MAALLARASALMELIFIGDKTRDCRSSVRAYTVCAIVCIARLERLYGLDVQSLGII